MNCATHNDVAAVAFCRTCGKPLCGTCTRDVRGVIYCESCLAARLDGTTSTPGFTPVPQPPGQTGYQQFMDQGLGLKVPPGPSSGPNPTVAGILAGFFPIGVGAVYCGQYAKGLVYLGIFVLTVIAQSSDIPWYAHVALGLFLAFFWVYQIMDAVRTARAVQTGEPVPDPFGLVSMFSGGGATSGAGARGYAPIARGEPAKIPVAAAVLIGLGVLFLLHTVGLFEFGIGKFWPLILIFLGCWIFAKNWGLVASNRRSCQCERCRTRRLMGPAILVTLGILFLLDSVGRIGFERTWPAILLVIGVVKLVQSNASSEGHVGPLPPYIPPSPPPGDPSPPAPSSSEQPPSTDEVNHV